MPEGCLLTMKSSPNKNITINTQRLESEPFILKSMKQNKDKYCVFYKLGLEIIM